MKTIRFKPENLDLLLQGPTVKSTTIRAGDKTSRFAVGERVVCRDKHRAVECEVTRLEPTCGADLMDYDAWADGFDNYEALWSVLGKLNRGLEQGDPLTIIGLRVVGEARDTRFEVFSEPELRWMREGVNEDWREDTPCEALYNAMTAELDRRKTEVQG